MLRHLTVAPFSIDAEHIAQGLLDMFDEEERVVLRFGMIPATKMEVVARALREKFLEKATSNNGGDAFVALTTIEGKRHVEFSMRELVEECMHLISLALYRIGDLVV